ncbi:anamorsin [Artemisia annua]|uniref:Anamorsin n=1 Tax=Artemisia annua TaxID=35608 RepID=A0A2U1MLV9_ARTAN|nr:anamorsin [Artemisia annua]
MIPLHEVLNVVRMVKKEAVEKINPLIITQASSLTSLQMESSLVDFIIIMGRSQDFPGDRLFEEFLRVLKPGGEIFFHLTLDAVKENTTSSLERKLLVAGFADIEMVRMAEVLPKGLQSFGVKGKKPFWKIGSSFSLKKPLKGLPKVEISNDMDLIDEDSLLSEEDLKKPNLPLVGDCEVGSTRKACKNCVCGRAEEEEKVQKLGVTMDQLENPQSACGSKVTLSEDFLAADV